MHNHDSDHREEKVSQLDLLLQDALQVLRQHFNMEVAFISQFKAGQRFFRYVDACALSTPYPWATRTLWKRLTVSVSQMADCLS